MNVLRDGEYQVPVFRRTVVEVIDAHHNWHVPTVQVDEPQERSRLCIASRRLHKHALAMHILHQITHLPPVPVMVIPWIAKA